MNPLIPQSGAMALTRRSFVKFSGGAGAGLILGIASAMPSAGQMPPQPAFVPGAYVQIRPDGAIILFAKNPEIGQGIRTSFALILAEELDARWSDVIVKQADVDSARYGFQFAGGSMSTPMNWHALRQAGAGARAMVLAAAARQWGVAVGELTTADSMVFHAASKRSASYGSLAEAAAGMPVPDPARLALKDKAQYKLLGKRHSGVDNRAIVTGKPLFGIDVDVPGMAIAVFQKCPAHFGRVKSANLGQIRAMPGVIDAFVVEGTGKAEEVLNGVAIIAKDTWSALSARRQLEVVWDEAAASQDSWNAMAARARELAGKGAGDQVLETRGQPQAAMAGNTMIEAFYSYGFVSHAQLEPMNCTAWYKRDPNGDSIELWAPTQMPSMGKGMLAGLLGIPETRVTIHQQRIGGGFGRRLNNDYMAEAAMISRQAGGIPVKLIWTREDDMAHDFYRPGGFVALKGAVDAKGSVVAMIAHAITPQLAEKPAYDPAAWRKGEFPANHLADFHATQTRLPVSTPMGAWRAPSSNTAAFVMQSFIHELAEAAGRDHAEFLDELLVMTAPDAGGSPGASNSNFSRDRARNVVRAAVERSGWGKRSLPKGRGLGLAFYHSHSGHVAEVAEVSVDGDKQVTVHKVWVVADVGQIVNLSGAEAQCQGSVIDGLSTMGLEVTMEKGRIEQANFDTYPLARIGIAPEIDVHFLDSGFSPTGLGEPALPPLAPAVCNAVFAAIGKRIRTMPITREGYSLKG